MSPWKGNSALCPMGMQTSAVITAAIDPCMSCTDRAAVWDVKKGKKTVYGWDELRKLGIEHYKRRGVDFSKL